MTALPHIRYFLGANSPSGFYSLYDQLISPEEARAVYILKGGPGCGKSTLMRRVAAQAEEAGLDTEYILCSGDPDSLDAVVLPAKGVAIVDGTAPQGVVPKGHLRSGAGPDILDRDIVPPDTAGQEWRNDHGFYRASKEKGLHLRYGRRHLPRQPRPARCAGIHPVAQ